MGLVLNYVKVYPPVEQYCKENDLIAEVNVVRDDNNPPHITYSFNGSPDQNPVYNYISIDITTGKIYLTLDGVKAINTDYPDDPSREIKELNFQVLARDAEVGDTLTIDVRVGVIRVHDEPPKIIDEQIYDIYQDDAVENERVLDIRTAFPSFFYINTDLIKIPEVDIGRVLLSDKGVDYVKNLDLSDPNVTPALTFSITIQDQQNNLTLEKEFSIPIKPGSALPQIPKKSILEEVGANIGQDLALKIETNKLNIDNLKFLNDIIFNKAISYESNINTTFYNSYIAKSIETNLIEGVDKSGEIFERPYETIKKSLSTLLNTINHENQKITDLLPENVSKIYNEIEKVSNEVNILNFEFLNDFDDTNLYITLIYNSYLQSLNYSKAYVNKSLELVDKAINYVASAITDEIFNLEKEFSEFKYSEYCNFKKYAQDTFSAIQTCLNKVVDQICGGSAYTNCCTRSGSTILTRLDNIEDDVSDLQNAVNEILRRHLEDWGSNTAWKFTSGAGSGSLQHNSTTVLYKSPYAVTFGSTNFSTIYIQTSGGTFTFNSNGLDLGSLTLKAGKCDCTATRAQYADLAEYYEADKEYSIGTIMAVGGEKEVTSFDKINNNLIGIISDKPGFILNSDHSFKIPALIGLKGRIKVKSKIPFKKANKVFADTLCSGYATTSDTGYMIGYALENSKKQKNGEYLTLIYFKGI